MRTRHLILAAAAAVALVSAERPLLAADSAEAASSNTVTLKAHAFPGGKKPDSMWSGVYTARSGKIYVGLCTHGDAANFYEFDPATQTMDHIADLSVFKGERGEGIRTSGKIHTSFVEDLEGNIYFGDFCEDSGPECIDPSSYRGAHWFKYDPVAKRLTNLGLISRHAGLLGIEIDRERRRLYGLAEDGHLFMFDLDRGVTIDKGRVDDWDICRTIASDDRGNIYGSFPVDRVWKYSPEKDRVIDLQNVRVPNDPRVNPRTMSNPKIDRKTLWRILEWRPEERVFYGVTNSDCRLFRFDPEAGDDGEIEPLALLCADRYLDGDPKKIPIATLAFTLAPNGMIYYAPVTSVSFDYSAESWDVKDERKFTQKITQRSQPPLSALVEYDIDSGSRREVGLMRTSDGRAVFGLGGAVYSPLDEKLYFVGAIEEHNEELVAGEIEETWTYSMALLGMPLPAAE
ncbi:hypothetical protein Mal64_10320 [Pseudobythopirellula maris]|uniref:SMP-30/Gluconolaconase/LRE-like region n=1 Tax=Pseudobythopirellula maris TaxID=2527991 RepID=A0A5C5ZUD0_9BACT|nr:hypothetical protein [Pseudobythopirellula maris]TWT90638.1 hypothetical protein Mal64_10320 [Pseudobythopirellula maris]